MKRILLDTQTLLWIRMDHPAVSGKARKTYSDQNNEVFVSVVSFWEIAIKKSLGKLQMQASLKDFIESALDKLGLSLLALATHHIIELENLPYYHRDPFDRILIAQALQEKMIILGNDPEFDSYGVKRMW